MLPALFKGSFKSFIVGLFSLFIVACGGDGTLSDGSSTGGTGTNSGNDVYKLAVVYTNTDGTSSSSFDFGDVITITATLTLNDESVEGAIINFANSDASLASLSVTQATTNSNGQATTQLTGGVAAGTGTVTVSTSTGSLDEIITNYTSLGDTTSTSNHTAYLVPSSTTVAEYPNLTGSTITTISSAQPGRIVIQLNDENLQPIPREIVYVELDERSTELLNLSVDNGGVATNADGYASLTLEATDVSGAGKLNVIYNDEVVAYVVFNAAGDGDQEVAKDIGTVELLSDAFQMASSGAQLVNLIGLVKDENNNLMEGVTVSFVTTSGGIRVNQATTGADGKAIAVLDTLNAPQTRAIEVTAIVGDKSDTVSISVTGTTIKINGNDSIVTGNAAVFSAVLLNSDGVGIAQTRVYLESESGNELTDMSGSVLPIDSSNGLSYVETDATGSAQFKFNATTSGTDTIVASALGESSDFNISVSPDTFVIEELKVNDSIVTTAEVPMIQGGVFKLVWEKDGSPFVGDVLFSTTRGQIFAKGADTSTATPITNVVSTDADGNVEVMLVSSNAGPAILTAKAPGLSATYEFEFVAETAHQITLQASPFSIGPNGQQSTISAVVRDIDGNLVKNRPVNFQLYDVSGGAIFPATNVTDSNGLATTVYSSSTVSSRDGVAIAACTDTTGAASNCSNTRNTNGNNDSLDDTYACTVNAKECVSDSVKVTVAERELFITAGLGNAVGEPTDQEYQYDVPVYVTDVNGNPISGVELSISAISTHYAKGFWVQEIDPEDDSFIKWVSLRSVTCPSEDIDRDGVLDVQVDGEGFNEDTNGNGVLDPGNIVRTLGDFVTDENGATMISLIYAQSYAAWVDIEFAVEAKMAGTEHTRTLRFTLPILQDDVSDEKFPPIRHNYGTDTNCNTTN